MKTPRILTAAAALVLLVSCTSSPPPRRPGTTASPNAVAATADSHSPSMAPSPAPPSPTTHPLGQPVVLTTIAVVTAYDYRQPVAAGATKPDQAGYVWGAADVKVCAGSGVADLVGITISNTPWNLVYDDSTRAQPSNTSYQQFPQPEFPFGDMNLLWGRCVRGWIVYPVPAGKKPVMVEYQPQPDSMLAGKVVDWAAA